MGTIAEGGAQRLVLVAVALLILSAWPEVVRADKSVLEIMQVGGGSSIYALSRIERIAFEGDTLFVTASPHRHYQMERLSERSEELWVDGETGLLYTDRYPMESIVQIDFQWESTGIESPEDAAVLIQALHLFQNQPNPFSPETRIEFDLPQAGRVELKVYAVSGRLVCTLVEGRRAAGSHSVRWDGRDDDGRRVASGVYFYNLAAPGLHESRKMILLP